MRSHQNPEYSIYIYLAVFLYHCVHEMLVSTVVSLPFTDFAGSKIKLGKVIGFTV